MAAHVEMLESTVGALQKALKGVREEHGELQRLQVEVAVV